MVKTITADDRYFTHLRMVTYNLRNIRIPTVKIWVLSTVSVRADLPSVIIEPFVSFTRGFRDKAKIPPVIETNYINLFPLTCMRGLLATVCVYLQ